MDSLELNNSWVEIPPSHANGGNGEWPETTKAIVKSTSQ